MPAPFDPYHKWLGILPEEQPPNYYRLLGVAEFEDDRQVIQGAADRQMAHVSGHRLGQWSALAQRLLNELAIAKVQLLQPETKTAYDAELRDRLANGSSEFALPADGSHVSGVPAAPPVAASAKSASPPPLPAPVAAPPVVAPPVVDPGQPLTWPAAAITPATLAAKNGSGASGPRRRFYLNGVLLVVLFSAAAAIGGAVFLAVVLRQIDESRSQAAISTVSANPHIDEDVIDNSSDVAANWTPPDKATNAQPTAAHYEPAVDTDEEELSPDMEEPAAVAKPTGVAKANPAPVAAQAVADEDLPKLPLVFREDGLILQVAVSPDGREAVSVAQDRRPARPNSVRFWNMEDGTQVSRDLKLPADVMAIAYSTEGRSLFVGTASGKASVVSLDTGETLALGGGAGPLAVAIATSNGAFLFTRPKQLTIEGWDRAQNMLRVVCDGLKAAPSQLAISGDNGALFTASLPPKAPDGKAANKNAPSKKVEPRGAGAGTLQLWEIQSKASAGGAANERVYQAALKLDLTGPSGDLTSVTLAPDARHAYLGGSDGVIHVLELDAGRETLKLSGHTAAVTSMSLSKDGSRMVTASSDRTVRVWAVGHGIELMRYDGHALAVRCVAMAPDGRLAISGGADGQLRIWRLPIIRPKEVAGAEVAPARAATASIFEPKAAVATPVAKPVAADARAPERPPTGTAHQRATAEVKKMFRLEIAAAKDPNSKIDLAAVLLTESEKYPGSYRFAMLEEAHNLAAVSGDLGLSLRIIHAIGEQFEFDTSQLTADTLEQISHQPLLPAVRLQLAPAGVSAAEEAIAAEKYPAARKLLSVAAAAARKTGDTRLTLQIVDRTAEATELQKAYDRFAAGEKTLTDDAADSAAHLAVGKYLCFVRQDWKGGLKHLAVGDNESLTEVARQEQTEPVESSDQVKLADAWWKLAQTAKGKDRIDFLARARSWYRAALPNLAGITETRVSQRLEELDAQDTARNRGR